MATTKTKTGNAQAKEGTGGTRPPAPNDGGENGVGEASPYHPLPLDTSQVMLADAVHELTEKLAKNTHDVWARQRIAEGWRYGPRRNDERKEHPCLVPYDQLTEVEKEYDRNTSIQTLCAIVALGYRVEKVEPDSRIDRAGNAGAPALETDTG